MQCGWLITEQSSLMSYSNLQQYGACLPHNTLFDAAHRSKVVRAVCIYDLAMFMYYNPPSLYLMCWYECSRYIPSEGIMIITRRLYI